MHQLQLKILSHLNLPYDVFDKKRFRSWKIEMAYLDNILQTDTATLTSNAKSIVNNWVLSYKIPTQWLLAFNEDKKTIAELQSDNCNLIDFFTPN